MTNVQREVTAGKATSEKNFTICSSPAQHPGIRCVRCGGAECGELGEGEKTDLSFLSSQGRMVTLALPKPQICCKD